MQRITFKDDPVVAVFALLYRAMQVFFAVAIAAGAWWLHWALGAVVTYLVLLLLAARLAQIQFPSP